MKRMDDKVAIITGAGSGIGRESALLFAREGARVVVSDNASDAGEETVEQIQRSGGEATFINTDVTRATDVERLVKMTIERYGELNILHNNAGIMGTVAFIGDLVEEDWDRVMSVNLKGVFLCSKYAVREMVRLGAGVIVNTASVMGLVGLPGNSAYSAAKGGVVQFTKTMALEYALKNIRVNCICAGWVDTPMNDAVGERITRWSSRETPMGRWGRAEEVAHAALYLASDESTFVTGTALVVDGSWVAR